jgi:hypothetical protein
MVLLVIFYGIRTLLATSLISFLLLITCSSAILKVNIIKQQEQSWDKAFVHLQQVWKQWKLFWFHNLRKDFILSFITMLANKLILDVIRQIV